MKTPKKATVAGISLLFAVLLGGCGVLSVPESGPSTATPVADSVSIAAPSPVPAEPTPLPEIVVFGAEASRSFQEGVTDAAAQGQYAVTFVPGGVEALASYQPIGSVCAIVYWNDPSVPIPSVGFPLFAYAARGQTGAENTPLLVYDASGAAEDALERAIAYPPHETPVRLIGLFSSETSPGYAAWKAAAAKGRIFSKAEFFLGDLEMQAASVWFAERLDEFYPGMIDAVFAETGDLAIAAVHQLRGRTREDMEVFSASSDANADLSLSSLMPAVVGADVYKAGQLCYESACALLQGKAIESSVFSYSTLEYTPEP
jgi:DNA-binding LacI/PurR family transcriptional regulator